MIHRHMHGGIGKSKRTVEDKRKKKMRLMQERNTDERKRRYIESKRHVKSLVGEKKNVK